VKHYHAGSPIKQVPASTTPSGFAAVGSSGSRAMELFALQEEREKVKAAYKRAEKAGQTARMEARLKELAALNDQIRDLKRSLGVRPGAPLPGSLNIPSERTADRNRAGGRARAASASAALMGQIAARISTDGYRIR